MTKNEELAYRQGRNDAFRGLLSKWIGDLGPDRLLSALCELHDVRKALRLVCMDFGDNDWGDDLHLGDVIEKHLHRNLKELDLESS